jgi:hypothetical protein
MSFRIFTYGMVTGAMAALAFVVFAILIIWWHRILG